MTAFRLETLWQGRAQLGEGPVWDGARGRLYWTDIIGRRLFRLDGLSGHPMVWDMPRPVGSFAVTADGGLLAAIGTGFARIDGDSGAVQALDAGATAPETCLMNDGKADRAGNFICGAKDLQESSAIAPAFRLTQGRATGWGGWFTVFNGPAFSPDGETVYFADSPQKIIRRARYDAATGALSDESPFAVLGPDDGYPDGMTVDADGFLWNAQWDGARLTRYAPDGRVDRMIPLPMRRPTSVAFAGPGLDVLVVTSAAKDQDAADSHAGSVLALHGLGVRGLAETPVQMGDSV